MQISGVSVGVDRSPEDPVLSDLVPDERERYVDWWRKFRGLENTYVAGAALSACGFWGLRHGHERILFATLAATGFLVGLGALLWLWVLYCPRCGCCLFEGPLLHDFHSVVVQALPKMWAKAKGAIELSELCLTCLFRVNPRERI